MKLPTKLADLKALAAEVEKAIEEAKRPEYKPGDRIYLGATVVRVDTSDDYLPLEVRLDGDLEDTKWLNPDQIDSILSSPPILTRASGRPRGRRKAS